MPKRRPLSPSGNLAPHPERRRHTLQCENCLHDIEPHRTHTKPAPRLCSDCTWLLRDRVRKARR